MATNTLNINGWDSGWPTGFVTNVDEATASPDGQTVSTTTDNDVVIFDLDATSVGVLDTVNGINITIRCRATSSGSEPPDVDLDVELLIGGTGQGIQNTGSILGSMTNKALSDAGWDASWTIAQLNGAQVRVTAKEGFGTGSFEAFVDCIDVEVDYTPLLPISRDPAAATPTLAGKIPDANTTNDFKIEAPPAAPITLAGQVANLAVTALVPAGQVAFTGKLSYLNALTEQLQINGWDSGWPTGFVTNVDEPSASADGQTVSTSTENDTVNFDLDDTSVIVNEDTVLGISLVVRARAEESAPPIVSSALQVSLVINGLATGLTNINLNTSMTNHVVTNAAWDVDLSTSQINSMQVRVTTVGIPDDFETISWLIDTIDVVVEYSNQSPIRLLPIVTDLDFTGYAPETFIAEIAVPSTETLVLAGQAPAVRLAESVYPSEEILAVTAQTPLRIVNFLGLPAVDALVLAGQALSVIVDFLPLPAIDTLVLAGKVPTAATTAHHVVLPARRVLTLAPEAPLIPTTTNAFVGPLKGTAALVGQVPTLDQQTSAWIDVAAEALIVAGDLQSVVNGHFTDNLTPGWVVSAAVVNWAFPGVANFGFGGVLDQQVTGLVVGATYTFSWFEKTNSGHVFGVSVYIDSSGFPASPYTPADLFSQTLNNDTTGVAGGGQFVATTTSAYIRFVSDASFGEAALIDNVNLRGSFLPIAVHSQVRSPAVGALALATAAPTGARGTPIAVTEGAMSLAATAPALGPLRATLTLATQQPAAVADHLTLPAAAALTITPQIVELVISGQITPVALLTLTTYVPTLGFSSFLTPGDPKLLSLTVDRGIEFIATPTDILLQ